MQNNFIIYSLLFDIKKYIIVEIEKQTYKCINEKL